MDHLNLSKSPFAHFENSLTKAPDLDYLSFLLVRRSEDKHMKLCSVLCSTDLCIYSSYAKLNLIFVKGFLPEFLKLFFPGIHLEFLVEFIQGLLPR